MVEKRRDSGSFARGSSWSPQNISGRTFGGRYRLQNIVGTGGSGSVYLAIDLSLNRQVAVKVLTLCEFSTGGLMNRPIS